MCRSFAPSEIMKIILGVWVRLTVHARATVILVLLSANEMKWVYSKNNLWLCIYIWDNNFIVISFLSDLICQEDSNINSWGPASCQKLLWNIAFNWIFTQFSVISCGHCGTCHGLAPSGDKSCPVPMLLLYPGHNITSRSCDEFT